MKMLEVFVFLLLVATSLGYQFDYFKIDYSKRYRSFGEEVKRRSVFLERVKEIEEHNAKYAKGEETYEMGINQFSDMQPKEVFTGLFVNEPSKNENYSLFSGWTFLRAPKSLDWRKLRGMTPVKDQGSCGSCWAFSAVGAIESCILINYRIQINLSEQQLVDCAGGYRNYGCKGGWINNAFRYIMAVGRINIQYFYPYRAVQGTCRFNPPRIGVGITGYKLVDASELALLNAVATYGPIAVGIKADGAFMNYKRGVYKTNNCGTGVNHAVIVAGYGTENGQDYWLVKNSWGTGWGDNGYIKMARNYGNMCRIANYASFPTC